MRITKNQESGSQSKYQDIELTEAIDRYLEGNLSSKELQRVEKVKITDYGSGTLALSTVQRQIKHFLSKIGASFSFSSHNMRGKDVNYSR